MNTINCRSTLDYRGTNFHQLSTLATNIRAYLNPFKTDQESIQIHSFEITQKLLIPLQKLDDLLTTFFNEAETSLTEEQKEYLTICERMVVACFCYIHSFIERQSVDGKHQPGVQTSPQVQNIAYEFYYNAAYELRTPYFVIKGYSQMHTLKGKPEMWVVHQGRIDELNYWVAELGAFINALPDLWRAAKDEGAA